MTKQELDILLDELKSDVARMRPTALSQVMGADVFWREDPLGSDYESSSYFDEVREDKIERSRRLRRPE